MGPMLSINEDAHRSPMLYLRHPNFQQCQLRLLTIFNHQSEALAQSYPSAFVLHPVAQRTLL